MMILSTHPPKKPAMLPISSPTAAPTNTATMPNSKEYPRAIQQPAQDVAPELISAQKVLRARPRQYLLAHLRIIIRRYIGGDGGNNEHDNDDIEADHCHFVLFQPLPHYLKAALFLAFVIHLTPPLLQLIRHARIHYHIEYIHHQHAQAEHQGDDQYRSAYNGIVSCRHSGEQPGAYPGIPNICSVTMVPPSTPATMPPITVIMGLRAFLRAWR